MCSGDKLLNELRGRQVKPEPLCCQVNSSCWCMRVKTKFLHQDDQEDCMSPAQMLAQASVKLPQSDIDYLNSLLSREFVPHS